MKPIYLILTLIVCAVPIDGASHTASSNQQSSESSARPVSSNHTSDAASAHDRDQKDGTRSSERGARRHISDKNHSHSQANPIKANRPKQIRNGHERSTSENAMRVGQASPTRRAVGAAKITKNSNLPVHTAGSAGISGQQLKNPHNRGMTPATVGGPASATRKTAAINGTAVNARRLN